MQSREMLMCVKLIIEHVSIFALVSGGFLQKSMTMSKYIFLYIIDKVLYSSVWEIIYCSIFNCFNLITAIVDQLKSYLQTFSETICFRRIIWLGDLNYRINLSYEHTRQLISKKNWRKLLEHDQVILTISCLL